MFSNKKETGGFTLIELLVVVATIGVLASIIMASLSTARAKSRDARRLTDMAQIQVGLELYYDAIRAYPDISADVCCDGWDQGPCDTDKTFIGALVNTGFMGEVPTDPLGSTGTGCSGYNYYRYPAGLYGCDAARGAYYVLGVRDMENSARPHPQSPGWSCPSRDWQSEFDWVIGGFEN